MSVNSACMNSLRCAHLSLSMSACDRYVQCSQLLTQQRDVDQEVSVHQAIVYTLRHGRVQCDTNLLQMDVISG